MSMRVWKHPTEDVIRIEYDEDQIIELGHMINDAVDAVPDDWTELVPEDRAIALSNQWKIKAGKLESTPAATWEIRAASLLRTCAAELDKLFNDDTTTPPWAGS